MATHVPRPLNERIGLAVSTLTTTGTPRRADRPSWTYCGVCREGGVDPGVRRADRVRSEVRVWPAWRSRPSTLRGPGHKRNARRNYRSVVITADVNTCDNCFRSGAPSSNKTVPRADPGLGTPVIHEILRSSWFLAAGCPQSIHETTHRGRQVGARR